MVIIWKQASNAQQIITLYVSFFQNDDDFYRPQEGNIFRSVCQSFCPGAGGLHPRGSGSGSGEWVSIQGEAVVGHPPPTGTRKVGGTHPTGMLVLQFTYSAIVFPENIFVKVK